MVGSMPWFAMAFLTMWLEESCFTHGQAATIIMWFGLGCMSGGVIGGWVVDWATKLSQEHGRIYVAQFSVGIGLPFTTLLFYGMPYGGGNVLQWIFVVTFYLMGATISWCGIVNSTIFADIVRPKYRSTIFALDRCIEGIMASMGGLLVGVLADDVFGFQANEGGCDKGNMKALGNALFVTMNVPWLLCFLAYVGLHWTYAYDRAQTAQYLVEDGAITDAISPRNTKKEFVELSELETITEDQAEDDRAEKEGLTAAAALEEKEESARP